MWIIPMILIGGVVGFIATRMMDVETGPVATIAIGVLGGILGGIILHFGMALLGAIGGLIGAVAGAMLVILIWNRYFSS